ncbi:FecR family protein [Sphingobacterium yanglingense]|uniref:FecR family protein n=1 Tax=Sphingobacterium yanglingense TaxID=1437280 RepID=A0A4R6WJQ3_9SPHI|nr:FecR family protein [Sphingobacterium yanglingense]TDQ77960.1 FecR family protein [Sphingobacterium yanglingense]
MDREEFLHIAGKVAEGTATARELEQYIYYLDWCEQQSSLWDEMPTAEKDRMQEGIRDNMSRALKPVKVIPIYRNVKWIAALLLLVGLSILFTHQYNDIGTTATDLAQVDSAATRDIAAAKAGITLTLADGRSIQLEEALAGNIAEQSGVKISKTTDGQIRYEITGADAATVGHNTLKTNRGEQIQVVLPDQTMVFLNAESSLQYPTRFTGQKREVTLTGEGYFEVAKNKRYPFIVHTDNQDIEVLGTHFNVNAYKDEANTKTTLVEGAVRVTAHGGTPGTPSVRSLKPGQQAVVSDKANAIHVAAVNVESVIDWKRGDFVFDADIRSIMRQLARWYNVEVVYQGHISQEPLVGTISKTKTLGEVLKVLQGTNKVRFKIEAASTAGYSKKVIVSQ